MKNAFVLNDVTTFEFYCKMFVNNIIAEAMHDFYTRDFCKVSFQAFFKTTLWHFKNQNLQHEALQFIKIWKKRNRTTTHNA